MKNASRLSRLERSIPKPKCECENARKPCRVAYPGDPQPDAWRCPKCGRVEQMIIVKYLAAGLCDDLL